MIKTRTGTIAAALALTAATTVAAALALLGHRYLSLGASPASKPAAVEIPEHDAVIRKLEQPLRLLEAEAQLEIDAVARETGGRCRRATSTTSPAAGRSRSRRSTST